MFMGEYAHNIDKKGRIIIPVKFREEFKDGLVITKGFDGCLNIYSNEQWDTMYTQLLKLPSTSKDARVFLRKMASKAAACEFDTQGRITIPSTLIKMADLQKECMIVGAASHVEIWSKDRWVQFDEDTEGVFEEVAEKLTEFLL